MSKEKLPVNWSEVCNQLKIDERLPFDLSMLPLVERNYMVAAYKLPYIVRAINGDWNSDYTNENQYKYFPYFIVKTDGNVSGSGRSCHVYGHWRAAAFVGVRLCFENKAKVEHSVKYFLPEYEAFLTYKNENVFDFENVEVKEVKSNFGSNNELFFQSLVHNLKGLGEVTTLINSGFSSNVCLNISNKNLEFIFDNEGNLSDITLSEKVVSVNKLFSTSDL